MVVKLLLLKFILCMCSLCYSEVVGVVAKLLQSCCCCCYKVVVAKWVLLLVFLFEIVELRNNGSKSNGNPGITEDYLWSRISTLNFFVEMVRQ